IELRRTVPDLNDVRSSLSIRVDHVGQWLIVRRGRVSLLVNFSDAPRELPLADGAPTAVLLSSNPIPIKGRQALLPPRCAVVLGPAEYAP
ncbi:MAG: DUF3459 domain-containing protein, partial [Fibrobacter sp.]|nr:DUF3459 domain-containing protein [Fibrobacter sp.]